MRKFTNLRNVPVKYCDLYSLIPLWLVAAQRQHQQYKNSFVSLIDNFQKKNQDHRITWGCFKVNEFAGQKDSNVSNGPAGGHRGFWRVRRRGCSTAGSRHNIMVNCTVILDFKETENYTYVSVVALVCAPRREYRESPGGNVFFMYFAPRIWKKKIIINPAECSLIKIFCKNKNRKKNEPWWNHCVYLRYKLRIWIRVTI